MESPGPGNSDRYVLIDSHVMRQLLEERQVLADQLALTEAELQWAREELDDLHQRVSAVNAIWADVLPVPRPAKNS